MQIDTPQLSSSLVGTRTQHHPPTITTREINQKIGYLHHLEILDGELFVLISFHRNKLHVPLILGFGTPL